MLRTNATPVGQVSIGCLVIRSWLTPFFLLPTLRPMLVLRSIFCLVAAYVFPLPTSCCFMANLLIGIFVSSLGILPQLAVHLDELSDLLSRRWMPTTHRIPPLDRQ